MNNPRRMMWFPFAASAAALAAAVAGIVMTRDWKLLLVVSTSAFLSEAATIIHFGSVLLRDDKLIGRMNNDVRARTGRPGDVGKSIAWLDCFGGALVCLTLTSFPLTFARQLSSCPEDAWWAKACLFASCACVPWCYHWREGYERLRKWSVFVAAFACLPLLLAFPAAASGIVMTAGFALVAFHIAWHAVVARKGGAK